MCTRGRWAGWLARGVVLVLAAGLAGVPAGPAAAETTSTHVQDGDISVGSPEWTTHHIDAPLTIPGSGGTGPASSYPSPITLTNHAVVTDVDVTLVGLTHASPDDLDVMLVGPGGQRVVLMSDAGGSEDATGLDVRFSDGAPSLPDSGAIAGGVFSPSDFGGGVDSFPAPAPANEGNTSLSVFNGTDPSGLWSLYVLDDSDGEDGILAGWRLHLGLATAPYPSTIEVAGTNGVVTDVNVTLHEIAVTNVGDLDVMLVGPGGQQTLLMSDAAEFPGSVGLPRDLTFDDEAPEPLPPFEPLPGPGIYRPTDYGSAVDSFDPPAPASDGSTALSVFDGTVADGEWQLFVMGDSVRTSRLLMMGWSLDLTWEPQDRAAPAGSVIVEGGAAFARSRSVTLGVSASDPGSPSSGVNQMRFSNDGSSFSAFQPYAPTAAWTLSEGDGAKTVYAQFRDAEGNVSAAVSDTIVLDQTPPRAVRHRPQHRMRAVGVSRKVKIWVSEALDPATVSNQTVVLRRKGQAERVAAGVVYDAARGLVVLTPAEPLAPHTRYRVRVKTKVRDLAGHRWDQRPGVPGFQKLKFRFFTR